MKKYAKRLAAVAVAVTIVSGGSMAFAYWTSTGTGTGSAAAGTATNVAIAETTSSHLYNSVISPLPDNIPSLGVEAYYFSQMGNNVHLASPTQPLNNVVVTMSSWACQSGSWTNTPSPCLTTPGATYAVPITFNIYSVSGSTVGSLITSATQTVNIPFRPSSNCPTDATAWQDPVSKGCFHGLATNITLNQFSPLSVVLPNQVVYGISYNTDNNGPAPLHGTNSPADSLNIAMSTEPANVTVGSDHDPGKLFLNSALTSSQVTCSPAVVGAFKEYDVLTTGGSCGLGTTNNIPAVQLNQSPALLYPGGPARAVDFTVTNPGSGAENVTSVTFAVSTITNQHASAGPACDPSWFTLVQPTSPSNVSIPGGQTMDFGPSGGSIALVNEPLNQDACQGATVNLTFAST
jgi:hypothetical protein